MRSQQHLKDVAKPFNEQKYDSFWNKLMSDHGPYSQQDVEDIRKFINEIDMDTLGVKDAVQQFKEAVLSMTMAPMRDGNGAIMRAPAEVNHAALPPRPIAGAPAFEIQAYYNALLAEEERSSGSS